MYVKRSLLFAVVLFATSSSLSTNCSAQDNPAYLKSRTRPVIPYKHATLAAPPGMVYIPGGSVTIKYSQSSTDTNSKKKVSLSSFYIDKTEVTNQQYRMFTHWVMDSIAVVQYLKDDKYFLDNPPKDMEKSGSAKTSDMPTMTPTTTDSATAATARPVDSISSGVTATPGTTGAATPATAGITTPATAKSDSGRRRRINWAVVKHKEIFESDDEEIKAKIAPMFDATTGKFKKELLVFPFTYLKATGTNANVKIGEYATENINIYPDEQVWFKDINNSQVEILVENYFTQPPYDDYPVVGVTWKQARSFAYWRSITNPDFAYVAEYLKYYRLQYSLPSEAQWVYAAGKDMKSVADAQKEQEAIAKEDSIALAAAYADTAAKPADMTAAAPALDSTGAPIAANTPAPVDSTGANAVPAVASTDEASENTTKKSKKKSKKNDGTEEKVVTKKRERGEVDRDRDGTLLVNFKQGEGDYTEDGANFTLPVMSYAPNEFGVYNMVGNVSEWVLDAYSPSTFAFVSDVNPVLLYDADSTDADAMKRKVIRGGSFVSNAKALSPFSRDFELQENAHCFIGFRCVMSAPDILNRAVSTRRKNTVTEKKAR